MKTKLRELINSIDKQITEFREKADKKRIWNDGISTEYYQLTVLHEEVKRLKDFLKDW